MSQSDTPTPETMWDILAQSKEIAAKLERTLIGVNGQKVWAMSRLNFIRSCLKGEWTPHNNGHIDLVKIIDDTMKELETP